MYASGTQFNFLNRLRCLPVSGLDLVQFRTEGCSYTGLLTGTKVQWNHVYAKSWAQMVPTGAATYYQSGAF